MKRRSNFHHVGSLLNSHIYGTFSLTWRSDFPSSQLEIQQEGLFSWISDLESWGKLSVDKLFSLKMAAKPTFEFRHPSPLECTSLPNFPSQISNWELRKSSLSVQICCVVILQVIHEVVRYCHLVVRSNVAANSAQIIAASKSLWWTFFQAVLHEVKATLAFKTNTLQKGLQTFSWVLWAELIFFLFILTQKREENYKLNSFREGLRVYIKMLFCPSSHNLEVICSIIYGYTMHAQKHRS